MDLWGCCFGKHTVNLDIGGDKVEDVVWRIRKLDANIEVNDFVLICGINNINNSIPEDIV